MTDIPPPPVPVAPSPGSRRSGRSRGTWLGIGLSVGFGIVLDAALDGPPGLGLLLAALTAAAGVLALTVPRRASLPFFAGGLALMVVPVLRASPLLIAVDTLGALCLFAAGAAFAREGTPHVSTARGYVARTAAVLGRLPEAMASLVPPSATNVSGSALLRRIPTTVLIVVPVVTVLAVLLGTADPVFGHLLSAPTQRVDVGSVPLHATEIAIGAIAFSVLAARARRPVAVGSLEAPIDLTGTSAGPSWIPLLVSVDLLFAAFVAVQFTYFFGGRTRVLTQEGLTFAQYARTGFWQLLAAAIITGGVIAFSWMAGGRARSGRPLFRWLAGSLVLLDLVVLASAFRRLTLYEDAFGWTWPRLAVHATILAVGALLLCGLVAVIRGRVEWLPTAAVAVATLTLVGYSALDPDAFIAERNLERYERTGELDVWELRNLSPDAVPALVAAYPTLDACARAQVTMLFEETVASGRDSGWASWNLGREHALDAIATLGPGPHVVAPAGCV